MITLFKRLVFDHWLRKLLSVVLALLIWMAISRYMTTTRVMQNIPVRMVQVPEGNTIEGMQASGLLRNRVTLTLQGSKTALEELSETDLEVVLNAADKPGEWIATIGKTEIASLNPSFIPSKSIFHVSTLEIPIKQSTLITERIPVLVTAPIGEAPKGYQYLGIFPYQLFLTVSGSDEEIKRIKYRGGLRLTFNLNDVSKSALDILQTNLRRGKSGEISYFVPNYWKKITIPSLSEVPMEIDDPQAKELRIDFAREELLPIDAEIPVSLFFSPKYSDTANPDTCILDTNEFVMDRNGIKTVRIPLCAQGVSRRFLNFVKDYLQILVIIPPTPTHAQPHWTLQIIDPQTLEDQFIALAASDLSDEMHEVLPHVREDMLRSRFRSYMRHLRLYTQENQPLCLKIEQHDTILSLITE